MDYQIKPIPEHEGYYADTNGDIWSIRKRGSVRKRGEIHKLSPCKSAKYLMVKICGQKGWNRPLSIHRLIGLTFLSNPQSKAFVCHRDGNPQNNSVENLYWGTPKENSFDRLRHGTDARGEKCPTSKLTREEVELIKDLHRDSKLTQKRIGESFGVSQATVNDILKKRTWTYGFMPENI